MLILSSQLDIVPGWLCIWSLPWSLYFYSLLPSEHNKDSHAKDIGWRFSELPESLSPPVKGARRLGNVQRGARQLHPLLHVLGHHQHELLLAAGSSEQLITMVLSWEKQALTSEIYNQWLILTSWAEYSEILPTPYWAVISRKCIKLWRWHSFDAVTFPVVNNYIVRIGNQEIKCFINFTSKLGRAAVTFEGKKLTLSRRNFCVGSALTG